MKTSRNLKLPSVLEFNTSRAYFQALYREFKLGSGKSASLGFWAMKLGYKSPRTFAMVIKGQRRASSLFLNKLSGVLKLSESERRYLNLMTEIEISEQSKKSQKTSLELSRLKLQIEQISKQSSKSALIDTTFFNMISQWYHLVIRQLILTPIGRKLYAEKPKVLASWIAKKLRSKLLLSEIESAIERLTSLNLIGEGSFEKISFPENIPREAIKEHHSQMIAEAKRSLQSSKIEEREITSSTFRFDTNRMKEAKTRVREFRDQFELEFSDDSKEEVFQFNLQFFPHTIKESK